MNAIEHLAEYLTGPDVGNHSVALAVGGSAKRAADRFFALRAAFGVVGYPTPDDAALSIREAIALPDLLAALKRNLPAIRMTANLDDAEAAEAAIAKAEERS